MPISEIDELLGTYKREEEIIDSKINQKTQCHVRSNEINQGTPEKQLKLKTPQQIKERNKTILRNLETVKGNLRSKAIFSPSEMQWKKIYEKYNSEPALVVTRWRCHLPIYV